MDRKEKLQSLLKVRSTAPRPSPRPLLPDRSPEVDSPTDISACREGGIPLASHHGNIPLAAARPLSPQLVHLAGLPVAAWSDHLRLILLDAETTGLAGGTGTYIFLMGLGILDPESPCLAMRQHFLNEPRLEMEFLARIRSELMAADMLVCFNGRSYDLPLLHTRFRLNGLDPLPADLPVLDLLVPARRFWRRRLGNCTLQNLEREAVGFHRLGDLPGALVPGMYFRFLRGAEPGSLEPVFEHNRLDLVGMAALLGLLNQQLDVEGEMDSHALECLLHCLLDRRRLAEFLALFAVHGGRWQEAARRHAGVGRALAYLCKRVGMRAESYDLFVHLSRQRPRQVPESLEEVLMHEEHILKDAAAALRHCDEFLALVESWPDQPALAGRLRYRRRRLSGKI
jgi:uncharacterized protein YprB with RNaseH-like and TPR domain